MQSYDRMIAYGIGALVLLWIIYLIWPYLVGFLAIVGAFQIYQVWKRHRQR